jgi:hypothetical protein
MRDSGKKPLSRKQTTDQETFDFTTPNLDVKARQVDMYAPQPPPIHYGIDPDVAAFKLSMEGIENALQGGTKIKKEIDKERKGRGMADAVAKKDPQEESNAYIMGHELIKGKAAAADLDAEMSKYFEEAKDEDPAKFKTGLDQLSRKFLAGRSEPFVEGILADAISIEQKYSGAYQAHQIEKTQQEGLTNLSKAFDYDITEILKAKDIPTADKAKAIREAITGQQEVGKIVYKLDRTEMSKHLLGTVIRKALELADPDLLTQVATLEDKHGVRLIDNEKLAPRIDDGIKAATAEQKKLANEFDQRVEKARQRVENAVSNKIIELSLDSNGDTKEAHKLLMKYTDPTRNDEGVMLDPGFVATAHKLLTTRGRGFALVTNDKLYVDAMQKAGQGKLSLQEVLDAKRFTEESEWKSLLSVHMREEDQKSKKQKTPLRKDFESEVRKTVDQAKMVDPFTGKWLDRNGPARAREVDSLAREWWHGYVEKNEKEPTHAEWRKEMDSILANSFRLNKVVKADDVSDEEINAVLHGSTPVSPTTPPPAAKPAPGGMRQTTDTDVRNRLEKMKQNRSGQNK